MTKIVQTFWNVNGDELLLNDGGYACPEIHWMSWALSCLQLCKFYPNVELYTTEKGKEIFNRFGLPYTRINTSIEKDCFMCECLPKLWVYSKIYTYSMQKEPFLHVDGDVFIWEPFDRDLLSSPIIAQNVENNLPIYVETLKIIKENANYIPDWITSKLEHPQALNAGILGGDDCVFFREYYSLAKEFYLRNKSCIKELSNRTNCLNLIIEQYLAYVLCDTKKIPFKCYSDTEINKQIEYLKFCNISKSVLTSKYLHALGEYKKSMPVNNFISYSLKSEYPEYWYRIVNTFKERNIQSDLFCNQFEMQTTNNLYVKASTPFFLKNKKTVKETQQFSIKYENISHKYSDIAYKDYSSLYDKQRIFCKKTFKRNLLKTVPFPFYKEDFDVEKYKDYYLFVNPYHEIICSSFNWAKAFSEGVHKKEKISPETTFYLLYINAYYYSYDIMVLSDPALLLIEELKQSPFLLKDLLIRPSIKNTMDNFVRLIESWVTYGIVYFSKCKNDFIAQNPSPVFLEMKDNRNNQIECCLNKIQSFFPLLGVKESLFNIEKEESKFQIFEIEKILNGMGFAAKSVKGTPESLYKIPLPCISLIMLRNSLPTYCVIEEISKNIIKIFNPENKKEEFYQMDDFISIWSNYLVLFLPQK